MARAKTAESPAEAPEERASPPARPLTISASAPTPTVLLDGGASRRGAYVSPTEAPIASSVAGTPSVTRWRVYRDVQGERTWLGILASHAQPEALIENFPGAMPAPGQVGLYFLRALNSENKETGEQIPFRISGDSPDVQRARAALTGAGAGAGATPTAALTDAILADHRAELKRQADAAALERRELADRQLAIERERAASIKAESDAALARTREEARIARDQEADRRKADRDEMEARYKLDREERERRDRAELVERERKDKLDRDERDRKDAREKEERAAEKERDREHREAMEKLRAESSIKGMATTVTALTTALGVDPKKILDRVIGDGDGGDKGTAAAIAETVSTAFSEFGQTTRAWLELKHGRPANAPERAPEPRRERKRLEDRGGDAAATAGAGSAAGGASEAPARNAALDAMAMPLQRKARHAMRELLAELEEVPEAQYQPKILAAVARTPSLLQYVQAVGVKAACVEAGMSPENADKVAAAVPASALK